MKQFFSFVRKEFYHIFRDRKTLVILLAMPIVQIILFGFALTNEVKNSNFAVLDQSNDIATNELINEIKASKYFDLKAVLHSNDDIEKIFKKGDVKLVVIFPANFNEDLLHFNTAQVQLIADASDPNNATTLTAYASNIIRDYQQGLQANNMLPFTIHSEVRMLYNPQLKGAFNFVPGVMALVLMLVCTMMTAITIVKEKETGTMEIMLVSPIQPLKIILAKAVPYLLLSVVNITTILLLSVYVLDVPIRGNIVLLFSESILFTITSLTLGLLISTGTDSQQTAMFISLVGMFLPTVVLSGFLFPIENMPGVLQAVSNIIPARWYYQIVKAIMIKGLPFSSVVKPTLILLAMTILFLIISIKKFKIRLA